MKQNTKIKSFIFAAAISLGAAASASAQTANVAVPNPAEAESPGLLGSRYTEALYNYIDLTGPGPKDANGFALAFNEPLKAGFDVRLGYDWARASYAGSHYTQQDAMVGGVAYTNLGWGRPFASADAGWLWARGGGFSDDSFVYKLGVGVEFQATPSFTVTPFVDFFRATGINSSEFDLGVKAAYRVTKDWSIIGRAQYDAIRHDKDSAEYAIGVAYHF